MRTGTRILLALALAGGMVACGGDDADVETFDAEEAATPAVETPTAAVDAPVMTARFEAEGEEAGTGQITGTVRIYREDTGTTAATAGEPAATEGAAAGEETTGEEESETAAPEMGAETAATEGGFRLEVTLNGLSQGEHAWHIHDGPCGEQAPVAVAISPTSDAEGIGESLSADAESATVESSIEVPANQLTLDQLRNGHYSLHVHQQGGIDHGPTVACANLSGEEDTATM